MGIMDLLHFVKAHVEGTYYPLSFPTSSPDDSIILAFVGGLSDRNTLKTMTVQFIIRSKHPAQAEAKANELIEFLNMLSNRDIGGSRLILSQAQQHNGLYLGTDSNGRHLMSANFRMIID